MITHLHFKPIVQRWEWSNYQVFLNQVVKHNLWSNISASHDVCLFCMYITIYCDMPITLIVRQIKHQQNYKCVSALLILTQAYVLFWLTDFLSFIDVGISLILSTRFAEYNAGIFITCANYCTYAFHTRWKVEQRDHSFIIYWIQNIFFWNKSLAGNDTSSIQITIFQ